MQATTDTVHVDGFECNVCSFSGGKLQVLDVTIPAHLIRSLEGERDTLLLDLQAFTRGIYVDSGESLSIHRFGDGIGVSLLMRNAPSELFLEDALSILGFLQDQGLCDSTFSIEAGELCTEA